MLSSGLPFKRLVLVVGDMLVFELALALTLLIRYGAIQPAQWDLHFPPFSILAFLWIVCFYIVGLYDLLLTREPLRLFRTYLEGMMANLLIAVTFFYLIPIFSIAPRTNLLLYFVVSLLLGYFWRLVYNRYIIARFSRGRVLFIGPSQEVEQIRSLLHESSLGMELVAAIPTDASEHRPVVVSIRLVDSVQQFSNVVQEEAITTVVIGIKPDAYPELKQTLYESLFLPVTLFDRAEIEEAATGRIPLSYVSETWFLHHLRESEKTWYEIFKRGFDIILSIPFCLFTILTFPLLAVLIKLSSTGPIFYSQIRIGKHGRPIRIWKYRTMHMNAESNGPQFTASTKTDPRVTRIGRLLRQLRLDELPQIWNVIRGDLSLVGPRPERQEFVTPLVERMPYYALRHLTRPGLTGWAQVLFLTPTTSLEDNLKKLQYDLFYIKHRSLLLDVAILLKTIGIVLRRQGT